MNSTKTKKLLKRFGKWFNTSDPKESLMIFGFDHGNGWGKLLENLFIDIEKILDDNEIPQHHFEVVQVKEKYAALRVYYRWRPSDVDPEDYDKYQYLAADEQIFNRIEKAEQDSIQVCEECGKSGHPTKTFGWIKTLCKSCHDKRESDPVIKFPKTI